MWTTWFVLRGVFCTEHGLAILVHTSTVVHSVRIARADAVSRAAIGKIDGRAARRELPDQKSPIRCGSGRLEARVHALDVGEQGLDIPGRAAIGMTLSIESCA